MTQELERELERLRAGVARLTATLRARFVGQDAVVDELLAALFAGGHALIEGAPGLGKTTLARTLAGALDLTFARVQCTPDLMPSDVIGARILEEDERGSRHFRFEPGPVFTHVLLADEINRATPRTQSALLEAMGERQVTTHGETRKLEEPFFVVATQNPVEMEGTYPLPEAQLDRFLLQIRVVSPSMDDLVRILGTPPSMGSATVQRALSRAEVLRLCELAREVPVSDDVLRRIARLVRATHADDAQAGESVRAAVRHGASPRGAQSLLAAARAHALISGRLHVSLADVERFAAPALRHRLVLSWEGEGSGVSRDALVAEALSRSAKAESR
ncbi:MAG: AAA family ATPase [Planctomycetota bacterium]|nr:AAA family ATPase [Planctomycetota bacterium]